MNLLKKIFLFLGSVYFAILLILLSICLVIAATILESLTGSHLTANEWIYQHSLFLFILSLYFINILFSSLRRWPFQRKHIPFLITHLGLLMVIAGVMAKQKWGIQGNMHLWEGSGSETLLLPHAQALQLFSQDGQEDSIDIHESFTSPLFPGLKIKLLGMVPHAEEKWETWIKGETATIHGLPPLPVHTGNDPIGSLALLQSTPWLIAAQNPSNLSECIQNGYLDHLTLRLSDSKGALEMPLKEALQAPLQWNNKNYLCELELNLTQPALTLTGEKEKGGIALQGHKALLNEGNLPFLIDLIRPIPTLLLAKQGDEQFIFAFDKWGRMAAKESDKSLIVYDQGFGGYAVQAEIPYPAFSASRIDKEEADRHYLIKQLRHASSLPLAPPVQYFKKECEQAGLDFATQFSDFLLNKNERMQVLDWKAYGIEGQNLLYPANEAPESFDRLKEYWEDRLGEAVAINFLNLETSVRKRHFPIPPPKKREDDCPALVLEFQEGDNIQVLSLLYDEAGMGLKWPILGGRYMVRFQPKQIKIP
ncbi:MAG: hypothetical protein LW832_09860, partial [Parachlamydia sp.]|nr:hypothetical protein [Parachlamydia sp.]